MADHSRYRGLEIEAGICELLVLECRTCGTPVTDEPRPRLDLETALHLADRHLEDVHPALDPDDLAALVEAAGGYFGEYGTAEQYERAARAARSLGWRIQGDDGQPIHGAEPNR